MVDFSNAAIECVNLSGVNNSNGLGFRLSSMLYNANKENISSNSNTQLFYENNAICFLYSGNLTESGNELYIGTQNALFWKISNISFNNDDFYSFTIKVYLPVPSQSSSNSSTPTEGE